MGVPLRQLLVAVHHVDRVIDVQDHEHRRLLIAPAPDINKGVGQADDLPQRRRILPGEMVGCEQRSLPVSGRRPHASLNATSRRSQSKSLPSGHGRALLKRSVALFDDVKAAVDDWHGRQCGRIRVPRRSAALGQVKARDVCVGGLECWFFHPRTARNHAVPGA